MLQAHLWQMEKILDGWDQEQATVLDVGSFDVNGTFRSIVEARGWTYTGLDLAPGTNVDVVSEDPYRYPFVDALFDIVISGSTMEHVPALWRWVPELVRVLAPGGMLALITHTNYRYHPHPVDCWRVMPDGMQFLFDETGELTGYRIEMFSDQDISGVARRLIR